MSRYKGKKAKERRPQILTLSLLSEISEKYRKKGYRVSRWITFSEWCLKNGLTVYRVPARTTESNYLEVMNDNKKLKIRFSAHEPNPSNLRDVDMVIGPGGYPMSEAKDLISRELLGE